MSVVKKNIMANFGGRAWQAIMSLAFVPLYIKFMGIESYGLVGFFMSLQVAFSLLDMGLSKAINKELARLSISSINAQEMRDFVRTLEIPYWCVAFLIGLLVISLSGLISHYWLNNNQLSIDTVQQAIMIMGVAMAFHWPISLYTGGLMGLQKQVLLNCIYVFYYTLKGVGSVLVLWLISPTIVAFFLWQIFASMVFTLLTAVYLWHNLPPSKKRAAFHKQQLLKVWRFSVGMTGISFTAVMLTQIDKVILSRMLSLEMFGYYTLATVTASALYHFIRPINIAVFPRFTQLASLNNINGLTNLYHKSCQFISVSILPAALVLSFFSAEILFLWTNDLVVVKNTYVLLSIYIVGTAFNGLMNLPYTLQIAYGWIKLELFTSIIAMIIMVPLLYFLTRQYSAIGAACAWPILNLSYFLITAHIMHRRLLKREKWKWYFYDVAAPMLASLAIVAFWRLTLPDDMSKITTAIALLGVLATALLGAALATTATRDWLNKKFIMKVFYGN